jgi:NAD+ kinase
MKIGIYGRSIGDGDIDTLRLIFNRLRELNTLCVVEHGYAIQLKEKVPDVKNLPVFSHTEDLLRENVECILSLGGDGTLLETLSFVKNTAIPVLGINLGRLGFLSYVPKEAAAEALTALVNHQYRPDRRSLLELKSAGRHFEPVAYALNDFTIHKRDTGSMISVETYLNGEYFSTYWADGVIVATPTGSTAYSLSCGGPILFPDSGSFVITPVAPHNLNIRPIVVDDRTIISFRVKGRGANHLISLDSRYQIVDYMQEIAVQKASFFFNLVKLNDHNFIDTLREKLKWGLDNRNF